MSAYEFREWSVGCILSEGEPRYERNPRRGTLQPTFLLHRFPIKGGLTFGDVLAHKILKANSIMRRFVERAE